MLSVQNIDYKIGNKVLLDNVSVDFHSKKINIIIGPNGAGKSTLIKIICQQLRPNSGTILYDNKNSYQITLSELSRIRAVLSQNIEVAFPITVKEVVMMGRYPHFTSKPSKKDIEACEETMTFFDVLIMADRNYMTLSGGEKQRVQFARVLAQIWYPIENSHRYLILDEPLTFLDVYYQYDFMKKINELVKLQDIVVIGVVHDLNIVAKYANQITLMNNGHIIANGNKEDVLSLKNLKDVYQLEPKIYTDENKFLISF